MVDDICIDNTSNINSLAVETTRSRVKEEHLSETLLVITSGAPVSIKHGVHLSPCPIYGTQVVLEPTEFPSSYVSSTVNPGDDLSNNETPLDPSPK